MKGDTAVQAWLMRSRTEKPTLIFGAGKAAVAMLAGLPRAWRNSVPTLLATKTGHIGQSVLGRNVIAFETSHPIPDKASLMAGRKAQEFVASAPPDNRLLALISGGASALVEHLEGYVSYDELVGTTVAALAGGGDIHETNRGRREISAIKGGKLLAGFSGKSCRTLAISDVQSDRIDVIAPGLGAAANSVNFEYDHHIIASNAVARGAVVQDAKARGLNVVMNAETMYADVAEVAAKIAKDIADGPCRLYVYGGEPTVVLPKKPGKGGRNQALALMLGQQFRGDKNVSGLVAGTDGTDRPTQAAGAFFDGDTFDMRPGASEALIRANSGAYLAQVGAQFITGPTGTNVMDLALAFKQH